MDVKAVSDGGVFKSTGFYKLQVESLLDLPDMCTLSGRETFSPHVFIADHTFPLSENILKPYSRCQEKIKNTYLFLITA